MIINDNKWKIKVETKKESGQVYGETKYLEMEIVLYKKDIDKSKDPKISLFTVLMHEIGHAYEYGLPNHIRSDGGTYADAFEFSCQYFEKARFFVNKWEERYGQRDKNTNK